MAYTRVYAQRISWENEPSINTPLNDVNLNKMDYALNQIDGTLATWDTTKANQNDLLLSVKTIDYDDETGVFIFTWQNGTTKTVDLNIEKIPVNFSMNAQGVITMTTDDGTQYTADVGSLIKTYTFTDSSVIDFTVTTDASGNKTVTADIVNGSITGSKLQPNYLADCQEAKTGAETAQGLSEDSAEDSEAWAVGQRNGQDIPPTDPAYHNNAKYWAEHTTSSFAGLTDTSINNPQNGQVPVYNSTTQKWENADQSAGGGSTIVVSTVESSLIGTTATITDGTTTLTATFDSNGKATFTGVTLTGNLTLTYTDGTSTGTQTISIPYFGNYAFSVSFFSATITITYPAALGATCSITDGTTIINATGSPMAFSIPNAGTWTATAILDGVSKAGTAISITTDGQTASDTIAYGIINLTFDDDFRGQTITCVNGGTTITKSAPPSGNTMAFYPPTTGAWDITGYVGGVPYSTSATVVSLATAVSATLQVNVTVTVTVYGAANETISFTDASGAKTVTTDTDGQGSVSITFIPPSANITFTSSVAKNPSDLSQAYSKAITISANTSKIYVMPDIALYWYGWKDDSQAAIAANGWTASPSYGFNWTLVDTTFNTNNVIGSYSSDAAVVSGIVSKSKLSNLSGKTLKALITASTQATYMRAFTTSNDFVNGGAEQSSANPTGTDVIMTHTFTSAISQDAYVGIQLSQGTNQTTLKFLIVE